jgi:hypothetical protein
MAKCRALRIFIDVKRKFAVMTFCQQSSHYRNPNGYGQTVALKRSYLPCQIRSQKM